MRVHDGRLEVHASGDASQLNVDVRGQAFRTNTDDEGQLEGVVRLTAPAGLVSTFPVVFFAWQDGGLIAELQALRDAAEQKSEK